MQEEGTSMAKMAVGIFIVVVVIAAVVGLVFMAVGWFNSGSDKLGDQVNSIDSSSYARYDDTQVAGTDVLTALKTFRDSDLAIVISTTHADCNGGYDPDDGVGESTSKVKGYNYCGLLVKDATSEPTATDGNYMVEIEGSKGKWGGFTLKWDDTTGYTKRNTNFSPTTDKSSGGPYVKQGAQFYANLIYDSATDEVCGILFRQFGKAGGDAD